MGELKAEDVRAAVITLQEYSTAAPITPHTLMLHPKDLETIQMELDFTTPEEIAQEESLWDE